MLKLDWATYESTKYACLNWHYSKTIPCGKLIKIGVWEHNKFIGVVLFSRGAAPHLGTPFGLKKKEICELTRIALTKHETPVSRIMAIAIKLLKTIVTLKCVISFADPDQGHHGGIYQANNWIYTGTSEDAYKILLNGKFQHRRGFSVARQNTLKAQGANIARVHSSGKHRYVMPLCEEIKPLILNLSRPYPKRVTKAISSVQLESGGPIPTDTLQI